jgi:hypothetical protein
MDFEQQTAADGLEGAVRCTWWAAGICQWGKRFATFSLLVIPDGQIAGYEEHLFPIFMHKRLGRKNTWRKP